MKIALGTTNQAKRKAVVLATDTEPVCLSVPSGVADQPLSEEETIQGAINRAKHALDRMPDADVGLGLEGGLTFDARFTQQWYLFSVCAAWDGERLCLGKGLYFPIPNWVGERVSRENIELGTIIDELGETEGSNQKEGAYGMFTGGRITRAEVFCQAVIAALTPLRSEVYARR
ncbi:DUF84 family protein [Brevibacillus humidisoli]|uniref:DUF84 family protein n=1 Tax=Brevibacillus humidisoli TaxID=2895522 RepID=UPI001E2FA022|nr:inosine/xanthosine triphosphatase [Brevibacillus humidisoli]UFJ41605.1 DUF84 family protein [Brevibacillus humidisoli]